MRDNFPNLQLCESVHEKFVLKVYKETKVPEKIST